MDQQAETTLLLEIEKRKSLIYTKNNSRKARDQKFEAWNEIKSALHIKCGKDFDKEQLQKKWSNLQERVKNKLRQRNMTGGGTSADLNTRDEITIRIIGETNPVLNMIPGAWPAPVAPILTSTPTKHPSGTATAQPGASSAATSSSDSATAVPASPVLPPVDCAMRKRKRTLDTIAAPIPPPCPLGEPRTLTPEERAYFLNGAKFYEQAAKYYARMNEDIRHHDDQMVYASFCEDLENGQREKDLQ